MTTSTTDSPFTDADQLNAELTDAKRGDTQRVSLPADAQTIVANFKANSAAGAWPTLDRATVADRLALILSDPDPNAPGGSQIDVPDASGHAADACGARIIQQGGLNLCGPAALMTRWAYRDPVAFATFATQLLRPVRRKSVR